MHVQVPGSPHSGHASVGACFYLKGEFSIVELAVYEFEYWLPSLSEFRIREMSDIAILSVRALWVLALVMRLL
jgi:hypothetical protein